MTLELALLINSISILTISFLWIYYYLKYTDIKMLLAGSFLAALIGMNINILSYLVGGAIFNYVYSFFVSLGVGTIFNLYEAFGAFASPIIFAASTFFVSFILLRTMYAFIILKVFKMNPDKKVSVSLTVLSFLTNAAWATFFVLKGVLF